MKARFSIGVAALTLVLAIAGCAAGGDTSPTSDAGGSGPQGEITVGTPLDVTTWNPHLSAMGPMMTYLTPVYDTLIRSTADGALVPGIASAYKYTDGSRTTFELTIRDGVVFNDGTAVDAQAVKANIEDAKSAAGPFSLGLSAVQSIDATGSTVTIHLANVVPNLETTLAGPAGMIVDPDALGSKALAAAPDGTGAYTLSKSSTSGTKYVLEARKDYWNPDAFGPRTLNLVVLTDNDARLNALISGQIDATIVFAPQASTAEKSGLTLIHQPLNVYSLALADRGGSKVPALGDLRVRQALNYAVDRAAIAKATTFGFGTPSTQMFPQNSPAFSSKAADLYPYDPDKARELLKEAGYGSGLTIPVFTEARFASYLEAIDGYLRAVGVTLDITTADSGGIQSWSDPKYAATVVAFGTNDPLTGLSTWAFPTSPNNPFKTELPDVGALRSAIYEAKTSDELKAAYQAVTLAMAEQAWFVSTNSVDTIYAYNPKAVKGITSYVGNSVPYVFGWTAVK